MDKVVKETLAIWTVLLVLFTSYLFIEPTITGYITYSEPQNYSDTISSKINSSTEYIWSPPNAGDISSIMLNGRIENRGSAKVYIEKDNVKYLIFESENIENTTPIDESTNESTGNNSIIIYLKYNEDSQYDSDNNGIESLTGVVDLTVKNSIFNINIDENKLCTRWEVSSEEATTTVCYGAESCCEFIDLESSREGWNETFYLYYGLYNATENNIVSAQVIYVDYNLSIPYSEIYYSEWGSLDVKFTPYELIEFEDYCEDTCSIDGFNLSSYRIIFEINNTVLHIDSIEYTFRELIEEVNITNIPPRLIKNISDISINDNESYDIDLIEYFTDDEPMTYDYYKTDNIAVLIKDNLATITSDKGFTGTRYMFFIANDSELTTASNVFKIYVNTETPEKEEKINTTRVVINRPVKWTKKVKLDTPESKVVINLTKGAKNISVNKIEDGVKEKITSNKLKVNVSGVVKDLDDYEKEQKIEESKSLPTEESSLSPITGMATSITGRVVEVEAEINSTEVIIEETVEEVEVEYYTEGPHSEEEKLSESKKRVVISSDIHFEDILAYTFLDTEVSPDAVKLYWIKNDTKQQIDFDKYDTNANGLVDYIEWVVPSLSNQTYEVEINILNIQSNPTVGGYWVVDFTTTGVANLTILASNGTQYGIDLQFTDLKCGDNIVNATFNGSHVFYENWNCSSIGHHRVKVLTPGKHTQMFIFGDSVAYAKNVASGIPQTINLQGKLTNTSGGLINRTLNFTFRIYNSSDDSLWEEKQNVSVTDGIYSVILGTRQSIDVDFDRQLSLGITAGNDSEMSPKLNLTSSPYTYRARNAENLTCTDCLAATQIQDIYVFNSGDTITGNLSINNLINMSSVTGNVEISGNLTVHDYITDDASTSYITIEDGNVVIYLE